MAMSDYQTKMLELEERKAVALEHLATGVAANAVTLAEHGETLVEINNHLAIVAMSGTEE